MILFRRQATKHFDGKSDYLRLVLQDICLMLPMETGTEAVLVRSVYNVLHAPIFVDHLWRGALVTVVDDPSRLERRTAIQPQFTAVWTCCELVLQCWDIQSVLSPVKYLPWKCYVPFVSDKPSQDVQPVLT